MLNGLSIAAIVAAVLLLAILLYVQAVRLGIGEPNRPASVALLVIAVALVPVAPAAGAWLAAGYGWTVAAWALGSVAGVIALAFLCAVNFAVMSS